jgi:hypothetical protein
VHAEQPAARTLDAGSLTPRTATHGLAEAAPEHPGGAPYNFTVTVLAERMTTGPSSPDSRSSLSFHQKRQVVNV